MTMRTRSQTKVKLQTMMTLSIFTRFKTSSIRHSMSREQSWPREQCFDNTRFPDSQFLVYSAGKPELGNESKCDRRRGRHVDTMVFTKGKTHHFKHHEAKHKSNTLDNETPYRMDAAETPASVPAELLNELLVCTA